MQLKHQKLSQGLGCVTPVAHDVASSLQIRAVSDVFVLTSLLLTPQPSDFIFKIAFRPTWCWLKCHHLRAIFKILHNIPEWSMHLKLSTLSTLVETKVRWTESTEIETQLFSTCEADHKLFTLLCILVWSCRFGTPCSSQGRSSERFLWQTWHIEVGRFVSSLFLRTGLWLCPSGCGPAQGFLLSRPNPGATQL